MSLSSKTRKWLLWAGIPLVLFLIFQLPAVRDASYNLMLNTLLKGSVQEISVEEAREKTDALLLDTRAREEFEISHLPGAIWVGYEDFSAERLPPNVKEKEILLYCSIGVRSEKIGEQLLEMGHEKVYNLRGGIFSWVNEGHVVTRPDGNPTDQVHPYSRFWGVWLQKGSKTYP